MPVAPYLGEIYRLAFGNAGMVAHPNRWLSQPEELVVAQNVTFENDFVQKEAAAADYDSIGIATEAPRGTFTGGSPDSTMAAIWLPAAATSVWGGQHASLVASTTSPWTVPVTNAAVVGRLLVLAVGQALHQLDSPILTSLTDTRGNTYIRQMTAPGNTFGVNSDVEIWTTVLTTGLTTSDSFTLTFTTAAADDRAACAASYTLVQGVPTEATAASALNGQATFSSATNTYIGRSYPAMLLAAVHWNMPSAVTAQWLGGFTQNASASSASISSQISLASKLVVFSTGIIAQIDWNPEVFVTGAGTVTTTSGSTSVVGVGTSFFSFAPGDELVVAGETHIIDSVSSNTALLTLDAWVGASAGVAYQIHSGPRVVTATFSGNIYRDYPDAGGNTSNLDKDILKTGLTVSRDYRGRFIQGGKEVAANNRKLFYFNGVDPVQVLSGTGAGTTAIATPPADWDTVQNPSKQPINGIVHLGHLIGFGNTNDPHRIYISDAGNHEVFTGANAFQFSIASNVGERLWCAAEFQGVCWFWKYPRGIFYLDDTDASFLNWSFHTRSEALGCARSPHAVLPIDDDVLFCNADGHFHLLSAVSSLGGQRTSDVTRMLGLHGFTRDLINTNSLNTLTSAWDPVTKTATFGLRSKNATTTDNDLLFRFDFGLVTRGGPIRFSYSTIWKPNALTIKRRDYNGRQAMLIGETATSSFINPFAYGFRTIAGVTTGFSHTVTTPQLDFSDQDPTNKFRRKHYDALELVLANPSVLTNNPLTVGVYVDNVLRQTATFTNASRRPMLQLKVGDGYEFAVSCSSASGSTVDIPQLGALVYFRPGGQDKSRAA
jgi:hypothetical protein